MKHRDSRIKIDLVEMNVKESIDVISFVKIDKVYGSIEK